MSAVGGNKTTAKLVRSAFMAYNLAVKIGNFYCKG